MEGKKRDGQVARKGTLGVLRAQPSGHTWGTGGEPRLTGCQELGRALRGFVGNFTAHGEKP